MVRPRKKISIRPYLALMQSVHFRYQLESILWTTMTIAN